MSGNFLGKWEGVEAKKQNEIALSKWGSRVKRYGGVLYNLAGIKKGKSGNSFPIMEIKWKKSVTKKTGKGWRVGGGYWQGKKRGFKMWGQCKRRDFKESNP